MTSIPTLGYPSQSAAIVSLCSGGMAPRDVAEKLCTSVNAVYRSLAADRKKRGVQHVQAKRSVVPELAPRSHPMWDLPPDERRAAFIRHASAGAAATRAGQA